MAATSNTDSTTINDRQAVGRQPDNSTPTGGTTPTSGGGGGTITAVTAGTGLSGGGSSGSVALAIANVGTAGTYGRVTTNAQGQVSSGFNDVINVRNYGAKGDGTTDDTTAINNAIAACTNYSTLYFPAGKYLITSQPSGFANLTNFTVCGDGWSSQIYSNVTGAAGNTFTVASTCSYVTIRDLSFYGSATIRGSGIHIRFYPQYGQIVNCYFTGCSDFAVHLSNSSTTVYSEGLAVIGCTIFAPLGDGIHVGNAKDFVVMGNTLINTGDDSIALVADNTGYGPQRGAVTGNTIFNGSVRGISVLECSDIEVSGNNITTTVNAGIELNRYLSTSAYNVRCKVIGNKVYNSNTSVGPIGAINAYFCQDCTIDSNQVSNPSTGAGIAFLDLQNTSISFNTVTSAPTYGIRGYTFGAAHTASNWTGVFIIGNTIKGTTTNDGIFVTADSGKTLVDCIVTDNVGYSLGSGVFITYQQINPGRIYNNTNIGGTYVNGGSFTGTTGNNIS